MWSKKHKDAKEQVNVDPTATSLSGQINLSFLERLSALTGLKQKTIKIVGISLVVIPVVILGAIFANYQLKQNRTVISVGEYKINQKTYDRLVAQAAEANKNRGEARQALTESLAARAAADKLGIEYPTDEASLSAAAYELGLGPRGSEYERQAAYAGMIKGYAAMHDKGGSRVALVYFPFSRYLIGGWDYGDKNVYDPTKMGNEEAVRQDISYAKQKAEQYRSAYLTKKKTASAIVEEVVSDKRLSYGQITNSSKFIFLTNDKTVESSSGPHTISQELADVIEGVGQSNVSDIKEELLSYKTKLPEAARGDKLAAAYYFVIVDKKIDKRAGILGQFTDLVKEYQKNV